jgi:hypothetical protein
VQQPVIYMGTYFIILLSFLGLGLIGYNIVQVNRQKKTLTPVKALSVRLTISVLLFVIILSGYYFLTPMQQLPY